MKKFIALLLTVALTCPLAACTLSGDQEMEITLPASVYGTKTEEEVATQAETYNCTSYTINDDGSVVYTLTKAAYNAVLVDIEEGIMEVLESMLDDEYGVEGFVDIGYNSDYTQFEIYVDSEYYTDYMILYAYSFFISGVYYQIFKEVPEDELDVAVKFIDDATGEIIKASTYQAVMASVG